MLLVSEARFYSSVFFQLRLSRQGAARARAIRALRFYKLALMHQRDSISCDIAQCFWTVPGDHRAGAAHERGACPPCTR